jgi:hypothetical protein
MAQVHRPVELSLNHWIVTHKLLVMVASLVIVSASVLGTTVLIRQKVGGAGAPEVQRPNVAIQVSRPTSTLEPTETLMATPTRAAQTATLVPTKEPTRKIQPTAEVRVIDLTSVVEVTAVVGDPGGLDFRIPIPREIQEDFLRGQQSMVALKSGLGSDYRVNYASRRALLPGSLDAEDTRYVVSGWVSHPSRFSVTLDNCVFVFDILAP